MPHLALQEGILEKRFHSRLKLLETIDGQRRQLEQVAEVANFNHIRQGVVSLMTDPRVRSSGRGMTVGGSP